MKKLNFIILIAITGLFLNVNELIAQTIWTGPTMTFTKTDFSDWTLEANQDRITSIVWITRANTMGIFNIFSESGYTEVFSPQDTRWAFGTTDNYQTLEYDPWEETIGTPPQMMNQDMVVHLITDDIYIDIKFTEWTSGGNGGGFTYERSTNEPLGIDEFGSENERTLYPNPTSDIIQISNVSTRENYQIFNTLGSIIVEGTIPENGQLSVQNFISGLYLIRFENGTTLRFIKI